MKAARTTRYCSDCEEIFDSVSKHSICPSCGNESTIKLLDVLNKQEGIENETHSRSDFNIDTHNYLVCRSSPSIKSNSTNKSEREAMCDRSKDAENGIPETSRLLSEACFGAVEALSRVYNCFNEIGERLRRARDIEQRVQGIDANPTRGV